jgi:HlyD family type I secretion membrane fusion protein
MQWHNLPARLGNQIQRFDSAKKGAKAIAIMDNSIHFMTARSHTPDNSAIAAVRKPLVSGLWVMLALSVTMLVWGALVPIDSAAVAKGKVVLLSNKKVIQHLEGGIIREILVKEGDRVTAGQPLIRLDSTAAKANRDMLIGQLQEAIASESRLVAIRDRTAEISFSKEITEGAATDERLAKIMAAQTRLFMAETDAQRAKTSVFQQRIAQSREEIEGLRAQIEGTSGQLDLLGEEIETVKTLLEKGYATKTRLYELERNQSQLQGNRGQYEAQIAKAKQNIAETEMAIIDQQKEFETKVSQELRDAQAQIGDLTNKVRAARDVAERTLITAPTGGIVTGLKHHTTSGVIAAGTPIMDIVPQDDQLIIESHVKPTDISIIEAGQDARIVFASYKMRNTPKVPGKVTQVSADSFPEERSDQFYYKAHVQVDKDFLQNMEHPVELYPGMPVDVLISTGSRSFLGYLFKPITDSMQRAFREE